MMANDPDWGAEPFGNSDENAPIEARQVEPGSAENRPFQANPYEASAFGAGTTWGAASASLPTYVVVMMILAIIFSVLRFLFGTVGAIRLASGAVEHITSSMYMEVGVNFISGILGVVASFLILFKKPAGVMFAWTYVLAIVASLGVAVIQAFEVASRGVPPQLASNPDMATGFKAGIILGSVIALVVRLMLLALFVAAVVKYARWLESRRRATTGGFNFR